MEVCELTVSRLVTRLSKEAYKPICQIVIQYLDLQDLESLSLELERASSSNQFGELIRTYFFLLKYINRVDRSFYYNFYQHPEFVAIENSHLTLLTTHCSNNFLQYPRQYRDCLTFIRSLLPQEVQPSEFVEELERMLTDTSIPLPKLKRENQGIFCKTSFQNFLVDLKYQQDSAVAEYYPPFQAIQTYFESQQQKYLQKLFIRASKDSNLDYKVRSLRFTPYQITHENYGEFLVPRNSLHNLLVAVYALTDVLLGSLAQYLVALQDPFHRFVELITRYSIYRNYVIEVEENLAFVFEQYDELYSQVFGADKPKYRFWRGAMTKWLLKFSDFHKQCNVIYYACLTKLRTEDMLTFLEQKVEENPQQYIQIKNKASLREYQLAVNELRLENDTSNGVEDFFQNNREQYQVILIEYLEYMVDLSINEETVHWCGHSRQPLCEPFLGFQKMLLTENKNYLNYIRQLQGPHSKSNFQRQYFQYELRFLENIQIKPITLQKIIDCYNMELNDAPTLTQAFQPISYDFQTNDETLKYFNEKANIKFQIAQEEMYFYSITPLVSANQLLTKSISTAYGSEAQDSEQQSQCELEYISNNSSEVEDYSELDAEESGATVTSSIKITKTNCLKLTSQQDSSETQKKLEDSTERVKKAQKPQNQSKPKSNSKSKPVQKKNISKDSL